MFNSLPDFIRKKAVSELFTMESFSKCWPIWQNQIAKIIGTHLTAGKVIDIGDHLSEIFLQTGEKGRAQSELSAGGAAWEALICWYINLCTVGSRIVAVKKMSLVPSPIQKAITVNYANSQCNTESDITIIVFPNDKNYLIEKEQVKIRNENGEIINPLKSKGYNIKLISDELCKKDFDAFEIGIVQCKTNWNDNSQIPMLWDMIYSVNGFKNKNINIGTEGFHIKDLKKFSYSFVTVPSNNVSKYKLSSVPVKRVVNLSGGNYWGYPTENIASSIKEIFNKNFQNGFNKNIRMDLEKALPYFKDELNYFNFI